MKLSTKIDNPPGVTAQPKIPPLEAFGNLGRGIKILTDEFKGLPLAANRHGTLQVMLSAARACESAIQVLISSEEGS